ncbi:MAG: class I SAM-dependent methyltransferase, partial [Alloacidobacterium sp.]
MAPDTHPGQSASANVYDAVEYPGFAYAHTHPDQLAVMALLYGLDPPPVETCRVLEVACNEGANLIPMAYTIPGAKFVGFDIAPECVARGQEHINALGLKNIRLFAADMLNVGPELGQFDYIIAHGLYAWVPEPVRDRALALCGELLKPNGVAFVSYNALPGSHLRQM